LGGEDLFVGEGILDNVRQVLASQLLASEGRPSSVEARHYSYLSFPSLCVNEMAASAAVCCLWSLRVNNFFFLVWWWLFIYATASAFTNALPNQKELGDFTHQKK
jgi:hypothetical protein